MFLAGRHNELTMEKVRERGKRTFYRENEIFYHGDRGQCRFRFEAGGMLVP